MGKRKMYKGLFWGVLIALIVVGLFMYGKDLVPLSVSTGGADAREGSAVNVYTVGTTTLSFSGFDAYDQGTAVGKTAYVGINGGTPVTGITSVAPNDVVDILLYNNTAYHNAFIKGLKIPENKGVLSVDNSIYSGMFKNNTPTLNLYADNGLTVLSNSATGGLYNQSVTAGKTYNHKLTIAGTSKTSTQDLLCVVELTNKTNVADVTLSGFGEKTGTVTLSNGESYSAVIPASYTAKSTSAFQKVYVLPAFDNNNRYDEGVIQVQSASGLGLGGATGYLTCHTFEYFVGADGKVKYNVEDTSATPVSGKHIGTFTYNWQYQP